MFMLIFDHLKERKILFNVDGHLLFGINRSINFEVSNVSKIFSENSNLTDAILDFFRKNVTEKLEKATSGWHDENVRKFWQEKYKI
jgi:hypothetical protein